MHNLVSRTERRKRRTPAPVDHWQPVGMIVKRLMRRHGLPQPTAIAVAELAGHNIEVQP